MSQAASPSELGVSGARRRLSTTIDDERRDFVNRVKAVRQTNPRTVARKVKKEGLVLMKRIWETLRNEHTIVNFLSPPEDEEANPACSCA